MHGVRCARPWFRSAEPLGKRRYSEDWITHTHTYVKLIRIKIVLESKLLSRLSVHHQGAFVLYNFREYVSERKMIRLLHGFLVDHQLLNEITKDVSILS